MLHFIGLLWICGGWVVLRFLHCGGIDNEFQSYKTEAQTLEEANNQIKHCFPVMPYINEQVPKVMFCHFSFAITDNQVTEIKSNQIKTSDVGG